MFKSHSRLIKLESLRLEADISNFKAFQRISLCH